MKLFYVILGCIGLGLGAVAPPSRCCPRSFPDGWRLFALPAAPGA